MSSERDTNKICQGLKDNPSDEKCENILETAERGCLSCLRKFYRHKHDINFKNRKGRSLLHVASSLGYEDYIREVISLGANIYDRDNRGDQAIHKAAMNANTNGNIDCIEILCNFGADINSEDEEGDTPVMILCDGVLEKETLHRLISMGADIMVLNKKQCNVLHYLMNHWGIYVVEEIINLGVEKNAQNIDGDTPLHIAVNRGLFELVRKLLELGVDPCIKNNKGDRAVDLVHEFPEYNIDSNCAEEFKTFMRLYMQDIPNVKGTLEGMNFIEDILE